MSYASVIVAPMVGRVAKVGIEKAVEWEMKPFDEKGTCFRDGSRWDWYAIGGRFDGLLAGKNVVQLKNLSLDAVEQVRRGWLAENYQRYAAEPKHPFSDIEEGETLEEYIERRRGGRGPIHAYAFLRNRHWNEGERMGWFGTSTATECGRKDPTDPDKAFGKCLHKNKKMNAQIVCWNEPEDVWSQHYYRRFIEKLHPEETIAVIDYHV
jgi:hypothetical protein